MSREKKIRAKDSWVDQIRFDSDGLVPAIIQDARTQEVLMVAYMNREALLQTLKTGLTHFYSRSRRRIWLKGETSGHFQRVNAISLDCDGDALWVSVHQKGGACHEGYRSCFFRTFQPSQGKWKITGKPLFDPRAVYGKTSQ